MSDSSARNNTSQPGEVLSCPETALIVGLLDTGWRFEELLAGLTEEGHYQEAYLLAKNRIGEEELSEPPTSWPYANRPHESLYRGIIAGLLASDPTLADGLPPRARPGPPPVSQLADRTRRRLDRLPRR